MICTCGQGFDEKDLRKHSKDCLLREEAPPAPPEPEHVDEIADTISESVGPDELSGHI